MSVSCESCVLSGRERSLRRAGHSFRGVLPNVSKKFDREASKNEVT